MKKIGHHSQIFALLGLVAMVSSLGCSKLGNWENKVEEKLHKVGESVSKTSDELMGPPEPLPLIPRPQVKLSKAIKNYCELIDQKFHRYGWGKSGCENHQWHHVRNSYLGRPLMWVSYGNEKEHRKNPKNMTMIFCTVHGDEITPTKFCFDIIKDLDERSRMPELQDYFKDMMIVVAPIVSPDSFFKNRPTRTNHRKVDVNRNFPTRDWKAKAHKLWKHQYRKDPRRYPGKKPLSEQETIFQVNLIKRYKPNKLISVHAPLTILDYDGPELKKEHKEDQQKFAKEHVANQLLIRMSNDARGYRIKDYPFFPGSLGNWAGNELKIPTYTIELPSSDNRNHRKYWNKFRSAIRSAIKHDFAQEEVNLANREKKARDVEPKKKL